MITCQEKALENMKMGLYDVLPAGSLDGLTAEDFRLLLNGVSFLHSLYETVKFTANYLKCVSSLDFSLRAAWSSHWLLGWPKQL